MKKGIPISPGIAVARAFRWEHALGQHSPHLIDSTALSGELVRFDHACVAVGLELDRTIERVQSEVSNEAAEIFRAHRSMLRDPNLVGKVHSIILRRQIDVTSALGEALAEYEALFGQLKDEYLRERISDIRDVVGRLMSQIAMEDTQLKLQSTEPIILVAPEILPSQAVMFDRFQIQGIVTETGGSTGHAAILARALGIPAVSGIPDIWKEVHQGDLIAMDGREGHVHINPGPEVESAYRKLQREYVHQRDRMVENRDLPAVSQDGHAIELLSNVNGVPDALVSQSVGASGVGLYRTEYLFLTHPTVPTESEQYENYRQIIEQAPNRRVIIRTLDLGGDKQVPYLGTHREANPFMGWRSVRLLSAYPDFFQTQLRAILRAGQAGDVGLLFPMISTVEEIHRLRRLVDRTRMELTRGNVPFQGKLAIGVMIEVPAAALCIDQMLDEVDFVSIGSNDLTQYVMAADRDNPKVAHLCEPFHPPVFRLLRSVIRTCNERGKPVTLCGEMAGRPRCVLPLLGMGLRRFSMSPAFVPTIKALIRKIDLKDCIPIAEQVTRLRRADEVRAYLSERLRAICPNIAMLDTL
ncbi:phosphoenolpyruvate--protein phosphotransferase [Tuwongella immobilis]|uniref:Phosphoenolpyruvate-protein phosphotransferase n=1 Tax=Tuwongella immobilis TaxID=692036 RepID=A0A6C2YMP9_9BACT|nr:phosphoenolpyruvate--protein phosphotransferase [Tuwongella immobilis]VIP02345.1 phosphoenolpyruvate-protein phosphotransferase : Phosphoenolpyruvate-protein phosphotransferase OS=Singulisphaera acidiphila (strain ATCC BAA-1392 / DSM 18658 / VKM B-2454 / MOB10) GN=Sinac_1828 PE=3 SV=1: PEP-utilisers_N: PEP-utilizers: PEP-utilizers_C [Tuwongella immobilis]VTS01121.1 phosphoenolpyruvate-protein phosphotransferase : Phosphoenolpyruvate-protein phosphotransferase OS=Singulisphaera acidiphila (stra